MLDSSLLSLVSLLCIITESVQPLKGAVEGWWQKSARFTLRRVASDFRWMTELFFSRTRDFPRSKDRCNRIVLTGSRTVFSVRARVCAYIYIYCALSFRRYIYSALLSPKHVNYTRKSISLSLHRRTRAVTHISSEKIENIRESQDDTSSNRCMWKKV